MPLRNMMILSAIIWSALPLRVVGAEDNEAALVIARTCVTCHHPENNHIPGLPGNMGREALSARLQEMREMKESDENLTVMHRLAAGIGATRIDALSRLLVERR